MTRSIPEPDTPRGLARRSRLMLGHAALLLAVLSGCARSSAPQEDVDFAKQYLARFASRSYTALEMGMDPALKDPQIRLKLIQIASVFPPEPPTGIRLVLSQVTRTSDRTSSALSFQYEYPNRWLRADVVVGRSGQARVVSGIHVQPLKEPLERVNRITLSGKGPAHYVALAAALIVLLTVAWTFVLAVRTPMPGMRWAWPVIVLLGVVRFAFNWTTGYVTIVPMGIQPLGAWFTRWSEFAPLVITTSIPVGAIVFLIQRHEWVRRNREDPEEDDGAGTMPASDGPGAEGTPGRASGEPVPAALDHDAAREEDGD